MFGFLLYFHQYINTQIVHYQACFDVFLVEKLRIIVPHLKEFGLDEGGIDDVDVFN